MWVFYSLLTAVFETGKDLVGKRSAANTDEFVSAFVMQLVTFLVLLPVVLIAGIPELTGKFWLGFFFGSVLINPLWSILYMRGLKLSPLSVSIPMLAFNPVFTAMFSIFFDKRWPDPLGWMGIMLVSAGFYLSRLSRNNGRFDMFQPINKLKDEPGAQAILGVALLWSLGIHFQKMVILGSSPIFSSITGPAAGGLMLFLIGQRTGRIRFGHLRKSFQSLFSTGLFHGLSNLAFMQALSLGYTPYAAAVKRSNIVFSSVLGSLFFGEEFGRWKAVGIACMVLGIAALVV